MKLLLRTHAFIIGMLFAAIPVPYAGAGAATAHEEMPFSQAGLAWVFFHDAAMNRPDGTGVDGQVDLDTGSEINDYARVWLGQIKAPITGPVTFTAEADNGLRLWIGGATVIDGWSEDGAREGAFTFPTEGALLPLWLHFYQLGGTAYVRLYWSWENHPRELIPADAFWHTDADLRQVELLAGRDRMNASAEHVPLTNSKARIYTPGQAAATQEPIRLKPGPHLFLDEFLIASSENVRRVVNKPQRDPAIPNPIVTGKEDGCFQPYMTILQDPETGEFRIWYGHRALDHNAGASQIGHMRSEDGIHWVRPPQALPGPGPIQFGVSVIDEGPDYPRPAQRFKYGWWKDGGLKVASSPDGLTWTLMAPGVVVYHNHDINSISWDPLRQRYVGTVSVYRPGDAWSGNRRITMQTYSTDLLTWTTPHYVVTPDDGRDDGETQFYAMEGYLIRGDLTVGMVKVLRDDLKADDPPDPPEAYGVGYMTLAWSRDGETWIRDQAHFFDPNPQKGAWDHAHAWIDEQVPVGDRVYLYYGGYARGHKVNRFEERQIGLVIMQRDRYVAREAGDQPGRILTPLVILDAEALRVNVDAARGSLTVQVLDADGQPIPGFTHADCTPITADALDAPVNWKRPLTELRGKPVRLEFEFRNTRMFGLELKRQ